MKKNICRTLGILLLLASAMSAASCGAESTEEPTAGTAAETVTEPAETEEAYSDNLPERDFGGESFQIYCRECCEHKDGIWQEAETGDVVDDAVYTRNKAVEERFNIVIEEPLLGPDGDVSFLRSSFMAGDNVCDLVINHFRYVGDLVLEGFMTDMNGLAYLDFSQPWWNSLLIEQYSIFDRKFVAYGSIDVDNITEVGIILFNKNIISSDFDINLYDCVNNGTWTIDKMNELVHAYGADTDGNGTIDPATDTLAFTGNAGYMFMFQTAMGQPTTAINDAGEPELCINTERMATIVNKLYTMLDEYQYSNVSNDADLQPFVDGRCLFCITKLTDCIGATFRDMNDDYGILPLPKYDEEQDGYYSHASAHSNLIAIPNLVDDIERVCIITEALTAEGYKTIRPAVYDVALKQKGARDDDSAKMIDIIYSGRTGDFADLYDEWGLVYTLDFMIGREHINTFSSFYAKNEKASVTRLAKAVKAFTEME